MIELSAMYFVEPHALHENEREPISSHDLSVVLPVYNEAQVIASTVSTVREVLSA